MINGKKFAEVKVLPFMMFGAAKAGNGSGGVSLEEHNSKLNIDEPERYEEIIRLTQNPVFAVFAFYRYYILKEKYKAVVKFNMDHKAYFGKRDQLVKLVNQQNLSEYW
jgi:hypothetical protein